MEKDILEVFIENIQLLHAGRPGEKTNIVLTLTWHFPRENVPALSVALPIEGIEEPLDKQYQSDSYISRILYKEERRGNSYFSVEISRIDDPGIFGQLMAEFLGWAIKGVANPYAGIGFKTILQQLDLKSEKIIVIASGKMELDKDFTFGEITIPLSTERRLMTKRPETDFGFNDTEDDKQSAEWVEKGDSNGLVLLSVSKLPNH